MKLARTIAATSLLLLASASFADDGGGPLDLSGGSTFFGRTPWGTSLVDSHTFTLPRSSYLTVGSVDSSAVGGRDVDFSSIDITMGGGAVATFANNGTEAQAQTRPAARSNALSIKSTQRPEAASYARNLDVIAAPLPEPSTCAMLFAGFGVMGFIARRRQQ